jgi:hypothetical protein
MSTLGTNYGVSELRIAYALEDAINFYLVDQTMPNEGTLYGVSEKRLAIAIAENTSIGSGSAAWGAITGNLASQSDLSTALNLKQNALGYIAENITNKSDSYTISSSTTYATTKAVVDGLTTKQNTLTNPITGTGTSGEIAFWNGTNTQTGNNDLTWGAESGVPLLSVGTLDRTSHTPSGFQVYRSNVLSALCGVRSATSDFEIINYQATNLIFFTDSQKRIIISKDGFTGINQISPVAQLDIVNSNASYPALKLTAASGQSASYIQALTSAGTTIFDVQSTGGIVGNIDSGVFASSASFTRANATAGSGSAFSLSRYRGSLASPSAVLNGDTLGYFRSLGWQNSAIRVGAQFDFIVDGSPSGNNIPTSIVFKSSNTGADSGLFDTLKIGALGTIIIPKKSEDGVGETLLKATVSDGGNSQFAIANGTANDNNFVPVFLGYVDFANTSPSLIHRGFINSTNDASNTTAVQTFQVLISSSSTDPNNGTLSAIANRPLFSFQNLTRNVLMISPNGSTAIGSNLTAPATAQLDVINSNVTQPIQKWTGTVGNTCQIKNDGSYQPASLTDTSATNSSLFYSTTLSRLAYKDSSGNVFAQNQRQFSTKTANYTLTIADDFVRFNGTSLTATLPDATTMSGHEFEIKNVNSTVLTINTTSSQLMDANLTVSLIQYEVLKVVSNGANWDII